MFTLRTVYFFLMRADEDSQKTRMSYFEVNKGTMFGLILTAILTVCIKWLEWGASWAAFPMWPCISWILWVGCQALNWFCIKSYAGLENHGWGTLVGDNEPDVNAMIKKDDDLRTQYNANQIQ